MSGKVFLVALKAGHNLKNRNQSPDGEYFEWERNQVVMDLAHEMFKRIPGIDSVKTKEADTYPTTLQGQVQVAIDAGADIYISKHSNARGTGAWNDTNGASVYIYPGRADSLALARIAIKHDAELLPMKNLGIKTANLYETRVPPMPAILYETGYHTNKGDVEKLKSHEFRVLEAKALVKTACEYAGVPYAEDDIVMAAKQHIVQPRETLAIISKRYGVTVEQLRDWNGRTPEQDRNLAIGTRLWVEPPPDDPEPSVAELQIKIDKLGVQLKEERANTAAAIAEANEYRSTGKAIYSMAMKFIDS